MLSARDLLNASAIAIEWQATSTYQVLAEWTLLLYKMMLQEGYL